MKTFCKSAQKVMMKLFIPPCIQQRSPIRSIALSALFLFTVTSALFSYRPYEHVYVGSSISGTGYAGATMPYLENVVYNPAALAFHKEAKLFYEPFGQLRVENVGSEFDYDVSLDAVALFGGIVPLFDTKWVFAGSLTTLFAENASSFDDDTKLSIRQFGFTAAYPLSEHFALGATAGFIFATELSYFTFSGAGTLGVIGVFSNYRAGLSGRFPIRLRWHTYLGTIEEQAPFHIRLANSYTFPIFFETTHRIGVGETEDAKGFVMVKIPRKSTFTLFADLEYQGWISHYYKQDGSLHSIDIDDPFVFGKDIQLHTGFEYYNGSPRGALSGWIIRAGFSTQTMFTSFGNYYPRYVLTLGTKLYAREYIAISFAFVDTFILEVFRRAIQGGDKYDTIEQFKVLAEIDVDIFKPATVALFNVYAPALADEEREMLFSALGTNTWLNETYRVLPRSTIENAARALLLTSYDLSTYEGKLAVARRVNAKYIFAARVDKVDENNFRLTMRIIQRKTATTVYFKQFTGTIEKILEQIGVNM